MKVHALRFLAASPLLLFLALVTCGRDSPTRSSGPYEVVVAPAKATLTGAGQTVRLSATVRDQAGQPLTGSDVRWSSGSPSVATVDGSGLVTARQSGTAVITASSGGVTGQATVTVKVERSSTRSISIAPGAATLNYWKETVQLTVTVYDGNGAPISGVAVSWSSGDENVATVDENGLVTAGRIGTTGITAAVGGATLQVAVSVAQTLKVNRIDLFIPGDVRLTPGDTWRIWAQAVDIDNHRLDNPAPLFTWSSDNPAVATVDGSGLVTAHGDGTARITAVAGYGAAKAKATETITVHNPDREVLIALYHAADGPNWTNRAGWLTDDPVSTWHGVSVDAAGRVTRLSLEGNRLKGTIFPGLDRLAHLEVLSLGSNELRGPIPRELGGLSRLAELDLSYNRALAGPLPQALTRLGGLRVLHADGTGLCAPRNAAFQAWLQGIGDRRVAGCENRDREALIALYRAADGPNWTNAAGWLTDAPLNKWHGVTASESGWVTGLDLSDNNLSGAVPAALGGLGGLTALNLSFNALSGPVPVPLSLLGLESLLLEGTGLCAPLSAAFQAWLQGIPDHRVAGCEDREALIALYHATDGPNWTNAAGWLTDAPLNEWHGVTAGEDGRVTGLNLEDNGLSGPIPVELGYLDQLRHLDFRFNRLTGPIPAELGYLDQLRSLDLANNRLSGRIPPALGGLRRLQELYLDSNGLSGPGLSGPIPRALGDLDQLQDLRLSRNNLTGALPSELGRLTNLRVLILDSNELSGPIPPELSRLDRLRQLYLRDNGLSGPIPRALGDLDQLVLLDLGNNPLSGPVPLALSRLSPFYTLYLDGTQTCILPDAGFQAWLQGLQNKRLPGPCEGESPDREALAAFHDATNGPGWTNAAGWLSGAPLNEWHGVRTDDDGRVTELALAGNGLSGPIPAELGLLVRLASLDLSGNGLSGTVPAALGNLEGLGVLDLSGNGLSGPVPAALGNLEGLGVLDLGDNDLRGLVPPDWIRLSRLEILRLDGTGVCAPPDEEFRSWLQGIADRRVAYCEDPDRQALAALYHAMNGPGWKNAAGWLSEAPLGEWQGVTTDENGRVTVLELEDDFLWGYIPPELGSLDMLRRLSLRGDFRHGDAPPGNALPPELGDLANLEELILTLVFLHGAVIPPELGKLQRLEKIDIHHSALSGPIPPELGNLSNLRELTITTNPSISGPIPSTLGNLERLEELALTVADLSGRIPPELSKLVNLERLSLGWNNLTGPIPPELGSLTNMRELSLFRNNLTGPIPPELGSLPNMRRLDLSRNNLTGPIPPELVTPRLLHVLKLNDNELTGPVPSELGDVRPLQVLDLSRNDLTGPIPPELGKLTGLLELILLDNAALSGPLPLELMRLADLEVLGTSGTGLCAPPDGRFWSWVQAIPNQRVVRCGSAAKTRAYLTQAVQSLDHPVPLVAGEPALLRVFVTAGEQAGADLPPVRATFYHDGVPAHVVDAPGRAAAMPAEIDEGSLSASINAEVPAWVIRPGLQMVIEVDPDGAADPAAGAGGRLPETGRMAVEVIDVPLRLTVVPLLWADDPDRSVLDATAGLTAGDDLFRYTRDLMPVGEFSLKVRDYVWSSVEPLHENATAMLRETRLVRTADGSDDYYMGVLKNGGSGGWDKVFLSSLNNYIIAHELGHTLSLSHAPCNVLGDPAYPYGDGSIGAWGYDFMTGTLVPPETWDIMSYCSEPRVWISDYHFTKAIRFRQTEATGVVARPAPARALLLWGGVDESGALILEPAFVADAAPSAPPARGPYRLSGTDGEGRVLFSMAFGMDRFADGEGGAFAFALPARPSWAGRLSRITLSGPEGATAIGRAGERATALLRDGAGRLRGILRDVPAASPATAARRALPEPGLEIVISRGVPEPSSW